MPVPGDIVTVGPDKTYKNILQINIQCLEKSYTSIWHTFTCFPLRGIFVKYVLKVTYMYVFLLCLENSLNTITVVVFIYVNIRGEQFDLFMGEGGGGKRITICLHQGKIINCVSFLPKQKKREKIKKRKEKKERK